MRIPSPARLFLALLLGVATVGGFAPFNLFLLPVLTLAVLFRLWDAAPSKRQAALTGFFFGLGFFGAGVSWVYVSLHDFGGMAMPVAVTATALFCAFLALFPALSGFALGLFRCGRAAKFALAAPALWLISEWVRGWILTGFPWLALGYAQAPASPLAGYAPLVGVYGVSLLSVISAGLVYLVWRGGERVLWAGVAVALWVGGFSLKQIEWTQPTGAPVSVSLLQGNISQDVKWRPEKARETLQTYFGLAQSSPSRLIILPETAIPLFYEDVPRDYLESLAEHARSNGGDLVFGIPEYAPIGKGAYFNSVMTTGSSPSQTYRKYHLVPFGEYIPMKPFFPWLIHQILHIPLDDFSRGEKFQQPLEVGGEKVAMSICYEDAFGEEMIRQLPAATLLANVSNDAWFGNSIAPPQHQQMAQMRALETGRYMLRATNTGMTAIIDQHGRVTARVPQFELAALHGTAQGFTGSTWFVRWGNAAVLVLAFAMLAGAWRKNKSRRRGPTA